MLKAVIGHSIDNRKTYLLKCFSVHYWSVCSTMLVAMNCISFLIEYSLSSFLILFISTTLQRLLEKTVLPSSALYPSLPCLKTSMNTRVTRLGDFLHFGQLFKAFDNNEFAQISYSLGQFL